MYIIFDRVKSIVGKEKMFTSIFSFSSYVFQKDLP